MGHEISYFSNGAEPLIRIIVVGTIGFVFLLLALRAAGSRTLAKMNLFDFIVTVGFGSVFGRVVLDPSISISEGVVAFSLLIALQYLVSQGRRRWRWFKNVVDSKPILLVYQGKPLEDEMRHARVCMSDIEGAIREQNLGSFADVEAVVLESGGHFAVVCKSDTFPALAAKLAPSAKATFAPNVASTTP